MRRTLLAATAILLLTAGCGGSDDKDSNESTKASPTAVPATSSATTPAAEPTQATTTAPPSTLIDYGDDGITVAKPADVAKLTGAPEDFTSFVVADLQRLQDVKDEVCTEKPQIRVSRIDRDWAAGGSFIPQCGGSATLWARTGGAWREVWGGQTLPECKVLEKYGFPAAVAGAECGTDDGKTRRYP